MIEIEAELSPARVAEIGRPVGAFASDDRARVAIASELDLLFWPGRAIYYGHRLRHRVSLYQGDLARRIGVFDGARFAVNDVAFHPSLPIAAIASGSYDGGYAFEGELHLWDWETGRSWSVLSELREVARCRFLADGTLAVALRPANDQDENGEDALHCGVLDDLRSFSELGLAPRRADPRLAQLVPHAPDALPDWIRPATPWTAVLGETFVPRHRVWDVAWLDDERVLAVHDHCRAEIWNTSGGLELCDREPGHGVQILQRGDATWVHVLEPSEAARSTARSALHALVGGRLSPLRTLDRVCSISIDRSGRFLCRDTGRAHGSEARGDRVLGADGATLLEIDLGHFDCFNHALRIDGEARLYFLRGTPPGSHQHKRLCAIEGSSEVVELGAWDRGDPHLMCSHACALPSGELVRSSIVYSARSDGPSRIEAFAPDTGQVRWSLPVTSPATAMVSIPERGMVVFAGTDGTIGLVDATTGALVAGRELAVDGVPSVAMSLAARGDRIAAGTIDGRVLVLGIRGT